MMNLRPLRRLHYVPQEELTMKKHLLRVLTLSLALTLLLTSSGLALTLRYPERGAGVLRLQTALEQLGYYSNTLDGVYGKGTRESVRAFQKAYGLTTDGVAGPMTIAKLEALTDIDIDASEGTSSGDSSGSEDIPATNEGLFAGVYSTIQYGATGDRVRILQRALLALGFEVSAVDGDFGSSTYKAVKAFQEAVGLTVDGKAGKNTLKKLETYFDEDGNCTSGPLVTPDDTSDNLEYDVPTRTLRIGMSGLDVQYTQQRLYTLGYYTGAQDGLFGSGMRTAVKAFQTKNGLDADGVIGAATRKVLFSTGAIGADEEIEEPETHRTLRLGMEGEDVAAVQLRLKELGYYTGTADGVYGSGTVAAVMAFQARNSLTADGVCGEDTTEKLYSNSAIDAGSSVATPTPTIPSAQPTETLKYGSKGDEVKSLQQRLSELGYYTGTIDGVYGSGTYNAVKFFQSRNALTVDGVAGTRTLALLFSDDAINAEDGTTEEVTPTPTPMPTPSRTLRLGYTGDDVKLLQSRLIDLGYLKTTASGIFDSETQTAVKAFQLVNGLSVDGVAGSKTYAKLFSDSALEPTPTPTPDSGSSDGDSGSITVTPDRALTNGDSGEDVKSVQQRLKELGYLSGTADGVYGDATTAAMTAFQQMNSLTATGNGNMATYARLFSDDAITAEGVKEDDASPTYTNLMIGSTGTAVIRLQQKLAELKYTVTVTGTYDQTTYTAVLAFQRRNALTPDGIAGAKTQTKLYSGDCVTGDTVIPEEDGSLEGLTGNGGGPASTSEVKWLMWYDDIKPNLKYGQVLTVYEPTTNTSYRIWVYARGRHLDCEPYTSQDAAILRAIWGGESWSEKPVYFQMPDGTWCIASTFSMPHGNNPIKDNDFDGQVCIHFPRTLEETIDSGDTKNGVRHQNDIRKHWLAITGENITW